jgi:D-amino-acid dehydrogenase
MKTEKRSFDVTILGGGIVGTAIARELRAAGADVLLLDKGGVGKGCSFANAGWVTPCFAMPLPQPGMLWKASKWLLDRESPLYIKPELSFGLAQWLFRFLRAMNERQMLESIAALTSLSQYSLSFYRELAERSNTSIAFSPRGLLLVSGEKAGLRQAELELELMGARGITGKKMSQEEVLAFEPALQPKVKGGVFFQGEAHVEPYQTTLALLDDFIRLGGELLSETEVIDFRRQGRAVEEIRTTQGWIRTGLVVLAAGCWSKDIARQLGCRIPLLGGKGYSMNIDNMATKPQRPIMIVERKIAVTPRAHSVRLAGTLELVDQDLGVSPHRVEAIHKGAREYLRMEESSEPVDVWRGLRPCTPDGVPLIGFSRKVPNLFYCVGHQLLGLQTAPASAKLAADLITKRTPFVDPKPFRPERYEG